jgi:hypothetical protein
MDKNAAAVELARKRWAGKTVEERRAVGMALVEARRRKRGTVRSKRAAVTARKAKQQ